MLTLGFDTATPACTVALVEDGQLLVELTVVHPRAHGARLMPLIAQALTEAGRPRSDLDGIAVGIGPGSFTGLRVGLATAKGLAFALGLPVAPVGTLEAMAHGLMGAGLPVAPMLDARRGAAYAALFDEGRPVTGPRVLPVREWLEEVDRLRRGRPVLWPGEWPAGADPAARPDWLLPAPAGDRWPRGWAVAALGETMLRQGAGVSAEAVRPLYLRPGPAGPIDAE